MENHNQYGQCNLAPVKVYGQRQYGAGFGLGMFIGSVIGFLVGHFIF